MSIKAFRCGIRIEGSELQRSWTGSGLDTESMDVLRSGFCTDGLRAVSSSSRSKLSLEVCRVGGCKGPKSPATCLIFSWGVLKLLLLPSGPATTSSSKFSRSTCGKVVDPHDFLRGIYESDFRGTLELLMLLLLLDLSETRVVW